MRTKWRWPWWWGLGTVLAMALPAAAQISVGAGLAKDFLRLGTDQSWQEIGSPLGAVSYDVVLDQTDGRYGLSFAYRAMSSMDAGGSGELVSEIGVEYFTLIAGDVLEVFAGLTGETWAADLTGETEFLGGFRGGTRFNVPGIGPFEVSGHWAAGSGGVARSGVFFGPRLGGGSAEE